MADQLFVQECYLRQDRQVVWSGLQINDGDDFVEFLTKEVAARVHDDEGSTEFEAHVRGLAITGFEQESLQALLDAAHQEDRDWAIGEALAEVHLSQQHGVDWPWNTERDKRTPNASLPGADLVGLMTDEEGALLALGEVKCSSEMNSPPGVMHGRSGMACQLDNLAENLVLLNTLLRWLFPRCKGKPFQADFDVAVQRLLRSGNQAIALFGVLIRDTQPNESDLQARARYLADRLSPPSSCRLTALHLPCGINELPARISGGGA